MNKSNVSIVIPVYNEAEQLAACLRAIEAQTLAPDEVIVVDNNSTDGTRAVARSFDFVKLLSESRQGVVHARNRGFNAARGAIIGRIDADTLLPPEWIMQVTEIFEDRDVSAVSGAAQYYDFALNKISDAVDLALRGRLSGKLKDENFLWGANMALRRSAWLKVRTGLCHQRDLHEDFDLAIHLQWHGHKVIYDESLLAGVSSRRIDTRLPSYIKYTLVSPKTYARHGLKSRRHMYPVLTICWLAYLPGRLIYRCYDQQTGSYSLSRLLMPSVSRPDPTTNIV